MSIVGNLCLQLQQATTSIKSILAGYLALMGEEIWIYLCQWMPVSVARGGWTITWTW